MVIEKSYKVYNGKYKNDYIESLNSEGYKESVKWLFDKTFSLENKRSKDVINWNLDIFKEFFQSRNVNEGTILTNISIFRKYIDWAMEKGHTYRSENPLNHIDNEFVKECVSAKKTKYFHADEIFELLELNNLKIDKEKGYNFPKILNWQEIALIGLVFFGVDKKSDLVNIKKSDVRIRTIMNNDEEYTVASVVLQSGRVVSVPTSFVKVLEYAINETTQNRYVREDSSLTGGLDRPLVNSKYLFRPMQTDKVIDNEGKLSEEGIKRRFVNLKDWIGEANFTIGNISKSGLLHRCKVALDNPRIPENQKSFSIGYFEKVFDHYGISENNMSRYQKLKFVKEHLPEVYNDAEKGIDYTKYIKR